MKRRPHHGAIDIIQAIYTPSLYAALSILNCPSVPITNGNNVTGNELVGILPVHINFTSFQSFSLALVS